MVFWPNFPRDFRAHSLKKKWLDWGKLCCSVSLPLRECFSTSRRKKFSLYFFGHKKRKPFKKCLINSLVVLQFSFLCHHKLKLIFFWPNRCDCNNIAHGIFSCHKLQDLFSQSIDKIWKLYMKSYSYQRDHRIPSLRARKAYQ